jgi:hypothetical protein
VQRWLILILVMFATACCSKAAPDRGAADDKADSEETDEARKAPAPATTTPVEKAEPDDDEGDGDDGSKESPEVMGDGAAEQKKVDTAEGKKGVDSADPTKKLNKGSAKKKGGGVTGSTGKTGRGIGDLQGGAGGKMAPAEKKPGQAGDKKGAGYREDFGVE